MIVIAGIPADMDALIGLFANGSVERAVLEGMKNSTEDYRFASEAVLFFELELRRETVRAAEALDKSAMGFAVFHDSRCNEDYWTRTENGGFLLRQGVSPAKAIRDIFANGRAYATECATAMVIVQYKALLEVYGEALFDRTFPSIYLMDWELREPLLREIGIPKRVNTLLPGDRGYFMNPQVDPETPWWQGENVIVLPGGLFYGHGLGIHKEQVIINSLNRNRRPDADKSAYLMDSAARPNYQKLYTVQARSVGIMEPEAALPTVEVVDMEEPVQNVWQEQDDVQAEPMVQMQPEEQIEPVVQIAPEVEEEKLAQAHAAVRSEEPASQGRPLVWKPFPKPINKK